MNFDVVSTHRWLDQDEVSGIGVQGGHGPDWEGGVLRDMSEGQARHDGTFSGQAFRGRHLPGSGGIPWQSLAFGSLQFGVDADGDAGDLLEQPGVEQLGQHPVKAIGHFVQVFEEEDPVLEGGLIGGAERGAEQGDVAADQRAGGDAAAQNADGLLP